MNKIRSQQLFDNNLNKQDSLIRKSIKKRLKKKDAKLLFKRLKDASVEKDVEDAWKEIFSDFYIKNNSSDENEHYTISSPFNTDGFISMDESSLIFALRILMEFKNHTDLRNSYDRCRIAAQIIHYMHNFKVAGYQLPTVLVGADESQAFILLATNFYKYLDRNYNWDCSPSNAYRDDPNLIKDLQLDANMSVFPFEITLGNFEQRYSSLIDIFESIESIVQDDDKSTYKIKVTPANITSMFDQFSHIAYMDSKKINPVESVNIFMQMLTGSLNDKYYFIPSNHNMFHLPGDKIIDMYGKRVEAFFNRYNRNISLKDRDNLKSIADRLIEANERRYKGDFWTPSIWGHRADEILKDTIGENYKEDCIIWDCAAGVRNLTRDFKYSNLFISTYHNSEIMLGEGYNTEAKNAFQYDFLNDDVFLNPNNNPNPDNWKMPNNLFYSLIDAGKKNKKVLFYTNPPYGTANNVGGKGTSKSNISNSLIKNYMKEENYGKSSQQLYAQFFARIIKLKEDFNLKNVSIGFFTNPKFFNGGEYWTKFNDHLFSNFDFKKGVYLNSGEFSDTSDTWPITFSVYSSDSKTYIPDEFNFSIEKSDIDREGKLFIKNIGYHKDFIVESKDSLKNWAIEHNTNYNYMSSNYPQLSSALNISKGKKPRGKLYENSLGYQVSNSNSIGEGTINGGVWIVSGSAYKGNGFNVMRNNLEKSIVNFTARRCIQFSWVNHFDNYKYPNTNNYKYSDFVNDSLVFSLFDNKSYQAAYRYSDWTNINQPGKWANQWFWSSKEHMINLANKYDYEDLYYDVRNDNNRYIYKQLNNINLSKESQDVINAANKVLDDTFKFREICNNDNPELFLNAWDAGWYQIKQINHKYPVKSYEEFLEKFKILKEKLSDNVYNLGMLKR